MKQIWVVASWRLRVRSEQLRAAEELFHAFMAFLGHLEQLARYEREFLQRRNDNGHRVFKRLGELPRALVDPLHDAALVLELVDRVLELLVEHNTIRDHDHAVENALVGGIMQGREPMRQPAALSR